MTNAIILYKSAEQNTWTKLHTVNFDTRRTDYITESCGPHTIEFQHVFGPHYLFLTHQNNRVIIWPTGGNEPYENAPKTLHDMPVVSHYDIENEAGIYRIYHQRHNKEKW